jgi:hypothetical protein
MVHRRAKTNTHKSDTYKILAIHMQTRTQVQTGVGKLLVDIAVSARGHEVYTALSPDPHCIASYGEIIVSLDKIRRGVESEQTIVSRTMTGKNCVYHEHGTGGICHKKMFLATSESVRYAQNTMPQ